MDYFADNGKILAWADRKIWLSISIPMKWRSRFKAALPVIPVPINWSTITSFFIDSLEIMYSNCANGFCFLYIISLGSEDSIKSLMELRVLDP